MKTKSGFLVVLLTVILFPIFLNAQNKVAKPASTVTDIDGNVYRTVKIGTQVWMAENLKTTKYRNGDSIANVTNDASWKALTTGAFCWYKNNVANKATYGGLYNWFAVADSRNIAPIGWHVATDAEWTNLTDFLGGEDVAGGKLKESGIRHWDSPDFHVTNSSGFATNSSGFTALPGGGRNNDDGTFYGVGYGGNWWSSTAVGVSVAWNRSLYCISADFGRYDSYKEGGFSVRCMRD